MNLDMKDVNVELKNEPHFRIGSLDWWNTHHGGIQTEELCLLSDVQKFWSWGLMYRALPHNYREAMKKAKTDLREDHGILFDRMKDKMGDTKDGTPFEYSAAVSYTQPNVVQSQGGQGLQVNYTTPNAPTSTQSVKPSSRIPTRGGYANRGQQRFQRSSYNSRGAGSRPRGSSSSQPPARTTQQRCQQCQRTNHDTLDCRAPKCNKCNKFGHNNKELQCDITRYDRTTDSKDL